MQSEDAAAQVTFQSRPTAIDGARVAFYELTLENRSSFVWQTSGPLHVSCSYHWLDAEGRQLVVADGVRTALPHAVAPGEQCRVAVRVHPPAEPGRYTLELDLVHEGVTWLGLGLRVAVECAPVAGRRVAIVSRNCVVRDAIGNQIVQKLRLLRGWGYAPLLLTGYVDERLALSDRAMMVEVTAEQVLSPDANYSWVAEHFLQADLFCFEYPEYYPLLELIHSAPAGAVIMDYHGVTPPELWSGEVARETVEEGVRQIQLVAHADYALAHSHYTRDELLRTGLVEAQRARLMPYPIETRAFRPADERPALPGVSGDPLLLYVGRMAGNKRIDLLVRMLALVRPRYPQARLLLVGDDRPAPYRQNVEVARRLAEELGVADGVVFTGQVDNLPDYYRACDIYVTSSLHEGFCIPVVEAMACGKPVVATAATALPSTLGDAGLLFAPGDVDGMAAHVLALLDSRGQNGFLNHRGTEDTERAEEGRELPIAFVVPRYGLDFMGGAENLVRGLAEALRRAGVPVEVLTTCTDNLENGWNNAYEPGLVTINGVPVRRFVTDEADLALYLRLIEQLERAPQGLSYAEQQLLMRHSVNSQQLYAYLRQHRDAYRCCIAAPYLLGTTYHAAQAMRGKMVHIPCLHDEPFARFAIVREMLEEARGLIFNTAEEQALARQLGILNPDGAVVGAGFDEPAQGDAARFRARYGLGDAPLLVYSGRLEPAKNVPLLLDYFVRYKRERATPLRLVMTGRGSVAAPAHPDIVSLGFYDGPLEDLRAAALALVQLSRNESLSLVLLESWLQGRPVIVHRDCAVTHGHVARSGGGWSVASYAEFAAALDQLLGDAALAEERGAAGRRYAREQYSWEVVLGRLGAALNSFLAPRPLYRELSQRGIRRALDFTPERYAEALRSLVEEATSTLRLADLYAARAAELAPLALTARPDYQATSRVPVVGRLIGWARTQLTSHLREPYLDPILARQEQFNRAVQRQLGDLGRLVGRVQGKGQEQKLREQQRQLAELRARVAALEAQLVQRDRAAGGDAAPQEGSVAAAAELPRQVEEGCDDER